MKRIFSIILAVTMLTILNMNIISAEETTTANNAMISKKEEIIREYQKEIANIKLTSIENARTNNKYNSDIAQIQTNTVIDLKEAGYEAYDVTPQTFESIEKKLNTNLEDAGLNPNYSYIVIIGEKNDNSEIMQRTSVSSSFTHLYNGTTYTLRWMTVYASDNPLMGKATDVNVLSSTSTSIIQNCLDAAISTYISSISNTLGTVASICGLSISNFAPAQQVTMRLNGATNWTRRYTQVWSESYQTWLNGCFVEEVTALSYMSGSYYEADTNRYMQVPNNEKYDTRYSSKFNDITWRKDKAISGMLNGLLNADTVGDVLYKYNGTTKITHTENF